jgi:hypothetical protein
VDGINKMRKVNLNSARGRLEYVLKCQPDIDADRLKVPAELQDLLYCMGKSIYIDSFKDGAKWLTGGLVAEEIGCASIYLSFQMANSWNYNNSLIPSMVFSASFLLAGPALAIIRGGIGFIYDGIKYRKEFKKCKWNRLLSARERDLNNYVLMDDTKGE